MNIIDSCNGCRYRHSPDTGADAYSAEWHRNHLIVHLAMFPNLDQASRDNLRMLVEIAEAREAKRLTIPCEGCGAESGQPCNPDCLSYVSDESREG